MKAGHKTLTTSNADQEKIAAAIKRALQHVARIDDNAFYHFRLSRNPDVLAGQLVPLTLDALKPLVDELSEIFVAEASRIADAAYGQVRVKKASKSDQFVIKHNVAKLVVDISSEQRRALTKIIEKRFDRDSIRNDKLVKDIKASVGLTVRDAQAVMNFRDAQEARGLSAKRVDDEVNRYSERLHEARAQSIARTETVRIETHARREGWRAAQKEGHISHAATVEWVAGGGCCEACGDMNGERVPLNGGVFVYEGQRIPGPPAHPRCGCEVVASDEDEED